MRLQIRYILCLLLCPVAVVAQERDYSTVDATAIFYPSTFSSTNALSTRIKQDFSDPENQLRAAYTWIIHNISYDPKEYLTYQFQYRVLDERNAKLASTREEIITRTMQGKKAVCEGYALTLERLCEQLEINAYVVRGDVKRNVLDINRPFRKNHMWLAAIVNNKPVLMDPTWGAGKYIKDGFKKEPSYAFYDVSPSHFIKTHYPEVFDDAYLDQTVSRELFASWPLIISEDVTLDRIHQKKGSIKFKELKKGVDFSIDFEPKSQLLYTFDDGIMREIEGNPHQFKIKTTKKTTRLILYDGNDPIIAYLVK